MKVRYKQGPAARTLDEVGRVERGEWVTVSKQTGERLVDQGWEAAGKKSSSSSKSKEGSGVTSESNSATEPETKEG